MDVKRKDLQVIFSLAKANYVDLDQSDLEHNEFAAKCWITAIDAFLKLNLNIDIPNKPFHDPED